MGGRSLVLAAALLAAGFGTGLAQPTASSNSTAPTASGTGNPNTARQLNPSTSPTQNPMVNPSAAGTQMGWTGYDRTSGATRVNQSPTLRLQTEREARLRLIQLGYSRIIDVRRAAKGGWLAHAHWGDREVNVHLNDQGVVVAQR